MRENCIAQELSSAGEIRFSRPRSRQVLGVMNDFAFNAEEYLCNRHGVDAAIEASLKLAQMPSSPISYASPDRLTLALFENSKLV